MSNATKAAVAAIAAMVAVVGTTAGIGHASGPGFESHTMTEKGVRVLVQGAADGWLG